MEEVEISPVPLARLVELLTPARSQRLADTAEHARLLLRDRAIVNVSSTAQGGGVAEMLQTLLAYGRGAGVDTRWLVIRADPKFFAITKRVHNMLHGDPGDGGPLGADERGHYLKILDNNLERITRVVRPGDVVLLHDPQTAGLVQGLQTAGAHVIWRCHVGRDETNEHTDAAWSFLREFLEDVPVTIFSRAQYAPDWVPSERIWVIPPSLDPFSTKNAPLAQSDVGAALRQARLVDAAADHGSLLFTRRDGSTGTVREHEGLLLEEDGWIPAQARIVTQVSRWDRLKDMSGVLSAFARNREQFADDVHLLLTGPDVQGVADDPEGAEVLQDCVAMRRALPAAVRARVHLCCLPMDDIDENAHLVNALQRYATVVVQKSLVEGFGLTVTEPMWKAKPVVASAVGGIQDQIVDGTSGLLVPDPRDLDAFAAALSSVLNDGDRGRELGEAARERVQDQFLGDRHLIQYVHLFEELLG